MGLMFPGFVACVLAFKYLFDSIFGMTCLSGNLLNLFAINPLCYANIIVLTHLNHSPFFLRSPGLLYQINYQREYLRGSNLGWRLPLKGVNFACRFTALNDLRDGKVLGRVVLTP